MSETSLNSLRATLVRTEEKLDDQPSYDNPVAATLIEDIESLVLRIRERERRLPPRKGYGQPRGITLLSEDQPIEGLVLHLMRYKYEYEHIHC